MKLQDVEIGVSVTGKIKMRNKRNHLYSRDITTDFMITLVNYMDYMESNNLGAVRWKITRKDGTKDILEIRNKRKDTLEIRYKKESN